MPKVFWPGVGWSEQVGYDRDGNDLSLDRPDVKIYDKKATPEPSRGSDPEQRRNVKTWEWFDVIFNLDIEPSYNLILLAYAHHADGQGGSIFPAKNLVAFRTGFTRRYVRKVTHELVEMGLLEVVKKRRGRSTTYRLTVLDHKRLRIFDEWMDEQADQKQRAGLS